MTALLILVILGCIAYIVRQEVVARDPAILPREWPAEWPRLTPSEIRAGMIDFGLLEWRVCRTPPKWFKASRPGYAEGGLFECPNDTIERPNGTRWHSPRADPKPTPRKGSPPPPVLEIALGIREPAKLPKGEA